MPTDFDFSAYLTQRCGHIGKVQRHKTLYEIYRLGVVKTGIAPFTGTIVAWPLGPVFLDIWQQPHVQGSPSLLTPADRALADEAISQIGSMSGKALADRSHDKYVEWGFKRLGLQPTETGSRQITPDLIKQLAPCDRISIERNKVKVFRPDDSVEELNRSVKQLAILYSLGARFEEVLIQAR